MGIKATISAAVAFILALLGARIYWGRREKEALKKAREARRRALVAGDGAARARADAQISQLHNRAAEERRLPRVERARRAYRRALKAGYPGPAD